MKMKITTKSVDALSIRSRVYEVYDDLLTGFLVRVLPSGLKSCWVPYAIKGIRDRIMIGHHGVLSVAQARDEAKKILGQVAT